MNDTTMTGAEALIKALELEQVDVMFGLPGGFPTGRPVACGGINLAAKLPGSATGGDCIGYCGGASYIMAVFCGASWTSNDSSRRTWTARSLKTS